MTSLELAIVVSAVDNASRRLEKRTDLLLSTLPMAVAAMGGSLSLIAEFPDRPAVVLSGISEAASLEPTARKRYTRIAQ